MLHPPRAEERQALILRSLPIVLYLEPLDSTPRVPQYVSGDFEAITGFGYDHLADQPDMVLDEGDEMLQLGFIDVIEWILEQEEEHADDLASLLDGQVD